jgi:hypothetical protein
MRRRRTTKHKNGRPHPKSFSFSVGSGYFHSSAFTILPPLILGISIGISGSGDHLPVTNGLSESEWLSLVGRKSAAWHTIHRGSLKTGTDVQKSHLRRTNESVSNWTELPDRRLYHFAPLMQRFRNEDC